MLWKYSFFAVFLLAAQFANAQIIQSNEIMEGQKSPNADLRAVISKSVLGHPTLRARQVEVSAAQFDIEAARWQYWPTPTVSVQQPDRPLINGTDRSVRLVGLRQPLWTGGRLEAALAQMLARKDVAEAALQEARRDIALEVIAAYVDACAALAKSQAWAKSIIVHERLLEQIRRRAWQGLSTQSDIELAEGRYQMVVADQLSAQVNLGAANERLQTLVGQFISVEMPVSGAVFEKTMVPEDAVDLALKNDPVLVRMQAELQELLALLNSSSSALWPEFALSINQRRGDVTGSSTQVMLGFESKWGGGMSSLSGIEAAKQRMQAKNEDIEFRRRKLGEQIRSELRMLSGSRERARVYERALISTQLVEMSWDRQYFAGKKSWQEVMNAAREAAQTEIQLIDAATAAVVAEWRIAVFIRGIEWLVQGAL